MLKDNPLRFWIARVGTLMRMAVEKARKVRLTYSWAYAGSMAGTEFG